MVESGPSPSPHGLSSTSGLSGSRSVVFVTPNSPPPTDPWAVMAAALGATSLVGLGAMTGVPAVVAGIVARQRISRSNGSVGGHTIASLAIVLGVIGSVLSLVLVVAMLLLYAVVNPAGSHNAPARTKQPELAMAPLVIEPSPHSWRPFDDTSPPLEVIDLEPSKDGLSVQLRRQAASARKARQTLVVQTTVLDGCTSCDEIAVAMQDPKLIESMAGVRIVRVDAADFSRDLPKLGMDRASVPWFFVLDSALRAKDAINADEWDANVPENIGPILVDFANGRLHDRRVPEGTDL